MHSVWQVRDSLFIQAASNGITTHFPYISHTAHSAEPNKGAHKRHSMTIYLFHEQRNQWMDESLTFFFTNPTFSEARKEKQHWEWICLVFSG